MSSKVSNAQRWVSCLVVDFAGTLAGCGGGSASKAVMTATPSVGLWDQPRTIVISHLAPGRW
ncbi:MAG: hypothetical protein JO181_12800 [Solirubrobacterales bacterium]|nr:hypothetical protein [Solirubrobacterales bacterium]